jgi:tungstate transport system substrate-binding protein
MKMRLLILSLLLTFLAAAVPAQEEEKFIVLASTTSTEASGLFGQIIPIFRDKTGIDVRVVAVGTGQAFKIARNGDSDSLLVHDTAGEKKMVEEGFATERRDVMYNDFVVIGPASDPAGVKAAKTAAEAFQMIREKEAVFASRGDDSGTHRAEKRIWESAGGLPKGSWYRELGSGMGATLNSAAAMDAYVLADRGTWISFANRQNLAIVFEGDPVLFNQYGSLLLSAERMPHLKHDLAKAWHEWLVSAEGQAAIAEFKLNGEQLFFPNAE